MFTASTKYKMVWKMKIDHPCYVEEKIVKDRLEFIKFSVEENFSEFQGANTNFK